jgi:hypothetical protein
MKKKPGKAKRSRAKARPRISKEFQLDIFGGRKIVARRPAPTTADQAAQKEFCREAAEYFASEEFRQFKAREAAEKARHRERLERRPVNMRSRGYRLPSDVIAFLLKLHDNPLDVGLSVPEQVAGDEAKEMIDDAYMEGCRQGFIEGFLYGEDHARPGALKNRERLRRQTLERLERLGIADRNAEIVAEFHRLKREMPGKDERYQHLAESAKRYKRRSDWPTSARQIGEIVRGFGKPRR